MATTGEAFEDIMRWVARAARVGLRRATIAAVLVALFAAALWWAGRERVSSCLDVTDEQRTQIESLRDPSPDRRFRTDAPASCVDGVYRARVVGIDGDMETATGQVLADGLALERDFLPFFENQWRHCFVFPDPEWARVELNITANRAGVIESVDVRAPETGDACESLPE